MERRLSNDNDHSWRNKNPTSYPVIFFVRFPVYEELPRLELTTTSRRAIFIRILPKFPWILESALHRRRRYKRNHLTAQTAAGKTER